MHEPTHGIAGDRALVAAEHAQVQRQAVAEVLNDSEMRERFMTLGVATRPGAPDEFRALISREIARWSKLIGEIGLKAE